ncbi:MAG: 16S rRNA (guanine(966)-N(2))-methyltransferase RsmD [Armatimonadota bacterium]|jgi:16S rRNA (guanine(966)-N(2))-methyltransferase RsmD|nr:16S rRNA (guanine(966)-N(2))-methyltransferase RsmD [Armatimonadota bacterium]
MPMRVIAGSRKGMTLKSVPGGRVRPTSDRLRGVLFNMLGNLVVGSRFLDLCAGTGAVGIEALSRGAEWATFVELSPKSVATIKANLLATRLMDRAQVICGDARRKLAQLLASEERFDIVFMDPPYGSDLAQILLTWLGEHPQLLRGPQLVIVQQLMRETLPERSGVLRRFEERRVSEHVLRFYSPTGDWGEGRW